MKNISRSMGLRALLAAASITALGTAMPAWAQQAADAQASSAIGEGDIVVTANRRAESLSRVPVSVAAISGDQLADRSIRSEADLQRSVAGLTVQTTEYSSQFSFAIRGQGIDTFSGGLPAVVPYVNDVQAIALAPTSFFDLESVQVLKGPQGTLFGRNATGGAVLYTTAKPVDEVEGYISGSVGNFDYVNFEGAFNIPLIGDKLIVRAAGVVKHRDGYQYNAFYDEYNGKIDSRSGRLSVLARPTESVTNTTVFQYDHSTGSNISPVLWSVNSCGSSRNGIALEAPASCFLDPNGSGGTTFLPAAAWQAYLAANPKVPAAGISAYLAEQKAKGPYWGLFDDRGYHRSHNWSLINTLAVDLTDDIQFKNITGVAKSHTADGFDADGSPFPLLTHNFFFPDQKAYDIYDRKFWSNESQIVGTAFDGSLKYIVGAFFARDNTESYIQQSAFAFIPSFGPVPEGFHSRIIDKSRAVFGQVTLDLTDHGVRGVSLTGGYRHTWETITHNVLPGSNFYPAAPEKFNQNKPSWTVGIQYQANSHLMLYVTQRGSWRSGGYNTTGIPVDATADQLGNKFLPETTTDIEAGFKYQGRVGDVPLHLNVAAYRQTIKDVQRTDYITYNGALNTLTVNVPKARVQGIEVDGFFQPVRGLTLGGTLAYTDAKYTSPTINVFGVVTTFGPYGAAPRVAASAYAQVDVPLPKDIGDGVSLRADAYTQKKQWFSNLGDTVNPNSFVPGYKLVNLQLKWDNVMQSKVTASAFVNNLFDKVYYTGGVPTGSSLGTNTAGPGTPRMYGLELKYKF